MKNILFAILIFSTGMLHGIKVSLEGPSRSLVRGEQFKIVITVAGAIKRLDTQFPANIYIGNLAVNTDQSENTSISIINGSISYSYSKVYYYEARKAGVFEIKGQKVKVGNKYFKTNLIEISISNKLGNKWQNTTNKINGNIFFELETDKGNYYKNEQIIVKLILYYRLPFNSFRFEEAVTKSSIWKEKLAIDVAKDGTEKVLYGKPFTVKEVARYAFFAGKPGMLQLPQYKLSVQIEVQSPFFGAITKNLGLRTAKKTLNILELPEPTSVSTTNYNHFSEDVGQFKFEKIRIPSKIKKGLPFRLKVPISGNGNLVMLASPYVKLPKTFVLVNTREINNFTRTFSGLQGEKIFEFIIRPEAEGNINISPILLDFFDPVNKRYQRVKTKEFTIKVLKNLGDTSNLDMNNMVETNYVSFSNIQESPQLNIFLLIFKLFVYMSLIGSFLYLLIKHFLAQRRKHKQVPIQKNMNTLLGKVKLLPATEIKVIKAYFSDVSEVLESYVKNLANIDQELEQQINSFLLNWKSLAFSKNKYEYELKKNQQQDLTVQSSFIIQLHKDTLKLVEVLEKKKVLVSK